MVMSTTAITFIVVIALEIAVIIIGNLFTIFVFWTQRFHLKRTYLLLINLAVADLLAAIGETVVLATHIIPNGGNEAEKTPNPSRALEVFGLSTSVFSLTLISLERVYAVLWPLRHRVTNTRAYIYSIVTASLGGWIVYGWTVTVNGIRHRHYVFCHHFRVISVGFSVGHLCGLPHDSFSVALHTTCLRGPPTSNTTREEFENVKNIVYGYCGVPCLMASIFRYSHNTRIMLVYLSAGSMVCDCSASGEFYGQSIHVQLQNANVSRCFEEIVEEA